MKERINGYTLALFSIAKEEKKLKLFKEQSLEIIQAVEENLEIIKILDSRGSDIENRLEQIDIIFKGVDPMLKNFLSILVQRSKFHNLINILRKLVKLVNDEEKIKEGIVYSTFKLSASEIKKISERIGVMLGADIYLSNKIDAELVSGIRIQVDDEVIEDTMNSRFEHLKNQLLEREEN